MDGFGCIAFGVVSAAWLAWFISIMRPRTNDELGVEVLKSFYDQGMYTEARNQELEKLYGWKRPGKQPVSTGQPKHEDYADYEAYEKARQQWEYQQGE